jgi:hypothetical protein
MPPAREHGRTANEPGECVAPRRACSAEPARLAKPRPARHDLRPGRLTPLAETGNLPGVAHLAGHRRVSTTALYVRPGRLAAERTLAAAGPTGFDPIKQNPTSASQRPVGLANPSNSITLCEGEDSNLHGSYPASTSS